MIKRLKEILGLSKEAINIKANTIKHREPSLREFEQVKYAGIKELKAFMEESLGANIDQVSIFRNELTGDITIRYKLNSNVDNIRARDVPLIKKLIYDKIRDKYSLKLPYARVMMSGIDNKGDKGFYLHIRFKEMNIGGIFKDALKAILDNNPEMME